MESWRNRFLRWSSVSHLTRHIHEFKWTKIVLALLALRFIRYRSRLQWNISLSRLLGNWTIGSHSTFVHECISQSNDRQSPVRSKLSIEKILFPLVRRCVASCHNALFFKLIHARDIVNHWISFNHSSNNDEKFGHLTIPTACTRCWARAIDTFAVGLASCTRIMSLMFIAR